VTCSSETSLGLQRNARHYVPEIELLSLRNTSCHSVQKLLYSDLLPEMHVRKTAVLYGCETCSHRLSAGHRLKVFENKVLKRL
jgi:hypothetical protein